MKKSDEEKQPWAPTRPLSLRVQPGKREDLAMPRRRQAAFQERLDKAILEAAVEEPIVVEENVRKPGPKRRRKDKGKGMAKKRSTSLVDNPDWRPDREGVPGFPRRIRATVNERESAVETLFARRFLGSAQKSAADRVREFWEAAGGTIASLDYSQDRVDGGRTERIGSRLHAAQELQRCRDLIGQRGYDVIVKVCAEGRSLADISPVKRIRNTVADNLRADLDDIATMWGIATQRKSRAKIEAYRAEKWRPGVGENSEK